MKSITLDHERKWQKKDFFKILLTFLVSGLALGFAFDPAALAFAIGTGMVFAYSMGIFHHMLFSHAAFRAKPWIATAGGLLGTLTWRGPMAGPIRYAALHRMHHRFSDHDGDPHSPVHGRIHAFISWMWTYADMFADPKRYDQIVPGLAARPSLRWLDRHVDLIQILWGLLVFLVVGFGASGSQAFDFTTALRWFAYAVFVKTALVLIFANAVDVVNHGIGYRNYETSDRSTNSALMGLIHLGGAISWHNNHHAFPKYFSVRRRWWELDVHYLIVKSLSLLGLTSEIRVLDDRQANKVPVSAPGSAPTALNRTRLEQAAKGQSVPAQAKNILKIPAHFLKRDPRRAILMMAMRVIGLALTLGVATTVNMSSLPLSWKVVAMIILAIVGGVCMQNLALVGHEGSHFNLFNDRLRSARWGTWVSALVPMHFNVGFAVSHAQHHRYTNTQRDPDVMLFSRRHQTYMGRFLTARLAASRTYMKSTILLSLGRHEAYALAWGLELPQIQRLARENILAMFLSLTLYVTAIALLGAPFAVAFGGSVLAGLALSSLRPYLEHEGTNEYRATKARTFASPVLDLFFGGINYHQAHHLSPGVPAYRVKDFHRWLCDNDQIGKDAIELSSLREVLRLLVSKRKMTSSISENRTSFA